MIHDAACLRCGSIGLHICADSTREQWLARGLERAIRMLNPDDDGLVHVDYDWRLRVRVWLLRRLFNREDIATLQAIHHGNYPRGRW